MTYAKFDDDFPFEMRTRQYSHVAFRLYVCLRVSKRNNLAGIYATTYEDLALESGLSLAEVEHAIPELSCGSEPMVKVQENGRRIFVWIIHQLEIEARHLYGDVGRAVRDNKVKGIRTLHDEHPTWPFWADFFSRYAACKPLLSPLQAPSKPLQTGEISPLQAPCKPLPDSYSYSTKTLTPTERGEGACAPARSKTDADEAREERDRAVHTRATQEHKARTVREKLEQLKEGK